MGASVKIRTDGTALVELDFLGIPTKAAIDASGVWTSPEPELEDALNELFGGLPESSAVQNRVAFRAEQAVEEFGGQVLGQPPDPKIPADADGG